MDFSVILNPIAILRWLKTRKRQIKPTVEEWFDAVKNYRVAEVRRLIAAGADTDAKNSVGRTALMIAAIRGHVKMADVLLSGGANPNVMDNDKRTALFFAKLKKHADIIGMLKDKDAKE